MVVDGKSRGVTNIYFLITLISFHSSAFVHLPFIIMVMFVVKTIKVQIQVFFKSFTSCLLILLKNTLSLTQSRNICHHSTVYCAAYTWLHFSQTHSFMSHFNDYHAAEDKQPKEWSSEDEHTDVCILWECILLYISCEAAAEMLWTVTAKLGNWILKQRNETVK